ncbi:hypothetical protein BC828DRAFT_379167 [Blastocladiella britannica]|nr:hypothetical protein BC828DRAFT_379167 [Blastocladiella britannica]
MSSPSSSSSAAARAVTVTAEEGEERRAASRCKGGDGGMTEIEDLTLYPAVPFYGPSTIRGLKPGETKRWCTCGIRAHSTLSFYLNLF